MSRHLRSLTNFKARLFDRISNVDPALAATLRDLRLDWYRISNEVSDDGEAEVYIYDEIGGSFGVDATEFVRELGALDAKTITVRINSPGGSLFDSIAIHNALIQKNAKIITCVDALAASGASIVAMAGDEVVMMPGSQMMIHDALGIEMGNARAMEAMARFLDVQSDNIADLYASKAGSGTRAEWRERMLAETWLFAAEAIEIGLADKVYTKPKPAKEDDDEEMPEMSAAVEELTVEALLSRTHRLENRGFRYAGRDKAPVPTLSTTPVDPPAAPVFNTDSKMWDEVRALVAGWK